jgi:hypothetical protein
VRAGVVALAWLAGILAFWWPLPLQMATHVRGERFDAWTTLWLIGHVADALRAGTLTAETDAILFPVGYNLWSFGHAALQGIGVLLVLAGVPLIAAYNLLLLGAHWTSALAAHLLGHEVGGGHRAGFGCGMVFATSPYLYGEGAAGCVELVSAGFLPFFAWTLVRLARAPSWPRTLAAAAALAVIGPFNWYYTLFAGMLGLGMWLWLREPRMLLAMGLAAALDAPLIPMVRRETPPRPAISAALFEDEAAWARTARLSDGTLDLADLDEALLEEGDAMQVIRNSTHVRSLVTSEFVGNPLRSTPGILAFAVGIAGAAAAGRRALGWLGIAGAATVLTLGPFLTLDDSPPLAAWSASLPLPYFPLYEWLPFFSKAYRPYRICVVTLTCLGAAGSAGIAAILADRRGGRAVDVALAALGLAACTQPSWAAERPGTTPLQDARQDPFYALLSTAEAGAVVEVPLHYQPLTLANARFQYAQLAHRHPLLNCNQLIRRPDLLAFRDYVAANPFLAALLDLGRRPGPWSFAGGDVERAVRDGFRWVVVHRRVEADTGLGGAAASADLLGAAALRMLRGTLGEPVLTSETAWAFRLPDQPESARWSWSDEGVEGSTTPLDWARWRLPLRGTLEPGPGARVTFWAKPEPAAEVRVGGQTFPLADGTWTLVEAPVGVIAADGVAITRLEVSG